LIFVTFPPPPLIEYISCRTDTVDIKVFNKMSNSWEMRVKVETLLAILSTHSDVGELIKSCAAPTWEEVSDNMVQVSGNPLVIPTEPAESWLVMPIEDKLETLVARMFHCILLICKLPESSALKKSLFDDASSLMKIREEKLREKILHGRDRCCYRGGHNWRGTGTVYGTNAVPEGTSSTKQL
jgi:hypothetical protein